ncbi:MAG: hypothetical protein AMJ46_14595 [Latescibacteria bacterium DG_63]|nr:MAG: hypothetical protein AMJ46_14595 [Latescibacteria bacterium DG_63]
MKTLEAFVCGAVIAGMSMSALATVLHVPSEYPSIQAGIDVAIEGDTVLVANGTYTGPPNRNLDFGGVNMVVMSENGPEVTIIDCEQSGRGFYFHSGEDASSVVQGFTITKGFAGDTGGGGIACCLWSDPTIEGNTISGNWASWGGGIYCDRSSPTIEGNAITENEVYNWYDEGRGGGISLYMGSPTIKGNTITENTASGEYGGSGGGIYCGSSSPTIEGNTISGNTAVWRDGGGIRCYQSSPTMVNCILWDNSPDEIEGTPVVTYSDIQGGWPGEGNIDAYPRFVKESWGDYRLRWGSPCIDTGHPDSLDPDGTRCDMGAHLFDQSKTLVTYATPEAHTLVQGQTYQVLYTLVNCHGDPQPARGIVRLTLPNGQTWPWNPLEGPGYGVMPPEFNWQYVREYDVPAITPLGTWGFTWKVGMPGELFDRDSFRFRVVEP